MTGQVNEAHDLKLPAEWPAWPIENVIPYARNPRKNADAVAKVAASLKEFGWQQPLVVDADGVLIAGHTRLMAARQLGAAEVPVHVAAHLTKQQAKAYRLADNRSGQEAKWDYEFLSLELKDLLEEGVDLSLTGFEGYEIEPLLQADWTPPAPEPEEPGAPGPKHSISLTDEQLEIFERAAEKVRAISGDETISDGRVVELIAADYLAGA